MLAVIAIAIIAAALSSPINWTAVIWMVITAMWVVCARSNQLTAEDWKQLYDTQSKTFNTLRQTWASTNNELVELRGKYQTLDDDYLKLAKQNEETSKENVQLHERVDDLRKQNSDAVAKHETPAQEPGTKTPKREYSEQDQARIREEMKSAGMKPKTKKRRPVDDED
jgi:DNA repair exonuclease SbcCD ATPase subunit